MIKILHFADAHIDMANFGRHDPETGLPMRVMDFLKSLDEIVDTAIAEKVDMVLFAGDTYKDRSPAPTFQREWGKRIMRLSRAQIPTLLLTGNHDVSPSSSRAHAIQEFDTLEVPFVHVVSKPSLLHPQDLDGLPLQVIALPWVSRSGMMASLGVSTENPVKIYDELELRLTLFMQSCLEDDIDPNLPVVLTAHASIAGAKYGNERTVMLGKDLVLPPALVRDQRLDYVAMDVKTSLARYSVAAGRSLDPARIEEAVRAINSSGVAHEFRTTCVPGIVGIDDVVEIARLIGPDSRLYLQQFRASGGVIDPSYEVLQSYPAERLREFAASAEPFVASVHLRGC